MNASPSPAVVEVGDRLFGALAVLRVVVLLNAVGLNIYRRDSFQHPTAAIVCVTAMILWTGFATWAYRQPQRRTALLLVADLLLAVALVLLTSVVKGEFFRATIPGSWITAALLAWAVHYRWRGGLCAGVVLATADLALRQDLRQSDYGNAFLLVLSGIIVGFLCGSLQQMAAEREAAERVAAAATERARLARVVHDGVLQVLALVQRRGAELGGEAADLGKLAGQQERELRRLIRGQDSGPPTTGTLDLAAELTKLEAINGVTVSTPSQPVELDVGVAEELVATVRACLDNVKRHVGEEAPAWVLLQADTERVEVCVRDDGPGIPPGRLERAEADGRLGVSGSIRGRIEDIGGTSELVTGSFGTEWEFVVPRSPLESTS